MIFETKRLYARQMRESDLNALSLILQDAEVMSAYEHAFTDEEVRQWLNNQINRYTEFGFGLWAVILKETDEMIGQCGLSMQECNGKQVLEIGYLFQKTHWHKGYASESADACKKYAFEVLKADEVYSIIRNTNIASMNVAIRNGMLVKESLIRHYYNIDMPHFAFFAKRE